MDSMIAKLIVSREKSVKVLEAEVAKLDQLASQSRVPAVQASLEAVALVKRQRLVKLLAELAAFRSEGNRQTEIPAVAPEVRKATK